MALLPVLPPALLALADGTTFFGKSVGAPGHTVGEVVFNTAMTGYQEILCARVVELTGLADNDGAGANDQNRFQVGALGHFSDAP
jgi:carbamoyl-phosphate synthase small subunit